MKIQELAAIMGGFFNIVYMLSGLLCWYIGIFERDRLLMNSIFKFSMKEDQISNKFNQFIEYNEEMF